MNKFSKIAVIDIVGISDEAKKKIQEFSESSVTFPDTDSENDEQVIKRIGNADAVLGSWKSTINQKVLDACPSIKYIGICGTSMANIQVNEVKKRGITITNVADYGDEATAEYIFTQLLILARGFGRYQWKSEPCELNGKTIGIVGLGAVGQQVARLALGFNMNVLYTANSRKPDWEQKGLKFVDLDQLLKASDIISLHVPKNTVVLKEKEFDLIQDGVILVDTCLGVVFDIEAFKQWTSKGKNFTVFDYKQELYEQVKGLKNVIGPDNGTAGKTIESRERLSKKALTNIQSYFGQS